MEGGGFWDWRFWCVVLDLSCAIFCQFCQGEIVRFLTFVPCWVECLANYIRTSTILKNKVDIDFARAKIESGTRTDLTLRDACSS